MATPFKLSQDNIELHFATNHLRVIFSSQILLGTVKSTLRERKTEGRIVNVSSLGHRYGYREGFCFDKINDESRYHRYYAYGQSKLSNILHANELTRRLKEEGAEVTANSLHPGTILRNLMRYDAFLKCKLHLLYHMDTSPFMLLTVQQYSLVFHRSTHIFFGLTQGAATTCFVALHPQLKGVGGEYFVDCNIA
ncbi:PREDICTED: short-chain dehydrogenase [Prunus dulcis]|uniref:PREDICTED: short-chain dehydrogenase n=1 Tax=Prunus dulcis TaxID=3755 RepID=A0A5E4GP26_PRUDU|nr:PREDICTED: short-chain dehydrogenase [Prunus dulcis]